MLETAPADAPTLIEMVRIGGPVLATVVVLGALGYMGITGVMRVAEKTVIRPMNEQANRIARSGEEIARAAAQAAASNAEAARANEAAAQNLATALGHCQRLQELALLRSNLTG